MNDVMFSLTDTENIRFVFAAVKDTILQLNLREYNLVWILFLILDFPLIFLSFPPLQIPNSWEKGGSVDTILQLVRFYDDF